MTGLYTAILALALTGAGTGDGPVLLDFSATWCGPCRQMNPVVDQLIAKGYPVRKIDYDRHRDLAQKFGVDQIPCFVMTVGGRETARKLGPRTIAELEEMFADAQTLAPSRMLPEPGKLPLRNVSNSSPQAVPIPLPHKQAADALPLETRPLEPLDRNAELSDNRSVSAQPPLAFASQSRGVSDADLVVATVRLRVHDARGPSIGTGTIIDSREGRALILTCGHIFRDYRDGGEIEVDLFGPDGSQTVAGRLLSFDDQRDVGLLTIQVPAAVKTVRVAPRGYSVDVGQTVDNVGCNHGDNPTVRRTKVTAQNKYMGPPNTEVAGLPVQGRSGGGLFSTDGYVIGVCNAADPQDNEGIYAALTSIHQQLDEANLTFIYDDKTTSPVKQAAMVAVDDAAMPKAMPAADPIQLLPQSRPNPADAPLRKGIANPLSPDEQRLLDELRQRRADGAEIVCIVRTRQSPGGHSEVFLFENASPQLIEQLNVEGFAQR